MKQSARDRKMEYVLRRSLKYAQRRLGLSGNEINIDLIRVQGEYIRKFKALFGKEAK